MFRNRLLPRSFYFNLLIRLIIFGLTCLGFSWSILRIRDEYLLVSLNFGILLLIQLWFMYRYMIKIDAELGRFFEAVRNDEFSAKIFNHKSKLGFDRFRIILEEINELIRKKSAELWEQEIWYKEVINQSPGGLVLFDKNGRVFHSNPAARQMLGINNLNHIKNLESAGFDIPENILSTELDTNLKTLLVKNPDVGSFINKKVSLAFKKSELITSKGPYFLLAFQNIKQDLLNQESESWKKLIRVLRHEIMNSLSPVGALSKSMLGYIQGPKREIISASQLSDEILLRISRGLLTIENTSKSILDFVNRFRKLTSIPEPKLKKLKLGDIMESSLSLIIENQVDIKFDLVKQFHDTDLYILADSDLFSQVLLNLINNSIEAMKETAKPKIIIKTVRENQNIILSITDNGKGIEEDLFDQIFVPFFTTREMGSGIGLTLVQQIVNKHKGEIRLKSIPGKGSTFAIYLPILN